MSNASLRFHRNSVIYTVASLSQRGLSVLLLPLYTRLLTPADNGVLAVVTSLNVILNVVFSLALTSAVTRFYFEYRENPPALKEFWGSVLTLLTLVSLLLGAILLGLGETLLSPFLDDVAFYPFVAIGIVTVVFQPLYESYLGILQAQEHAGRYGAVGIANFFVRASLAILLVAGWGWGVEGALIANATTSIIFFAISILALRDRIHIGFRWPSLRIALRYSLPLLPHALAGQGRTVIDRLLLNFLAGAAAAGVYHVAFLFGHVVQIVAISAHRAFTPRFLAAMKEDNDTALRALRRLGLGLVCVYTFLATAISTFAREIVFVVTGPDFHAAYQPVPFLAFAFAANGIYLLAVSVLYYEPRHVKWVAAGTGTGCVVSVTLAFLLIPGWGMGGAAAATLISQLVVTVTTAAIAGRHSRIPWDYGRFASIFALSFLIALLLNPIGERVSWSLFGLKAVALLGFLGLLLLVGWGSLKSMPPDDPPELAQVTP